MQMTHPSKFCAFFLLFVTLPAWSAITRTQKGSGQIKASGTILGIDALTGGAVPAGASIIAVLSHDPVTVSSIELKDNGADNICDTGDTLIATLSKGPEATNTGNVQGSIWSAHNVAANGDCVLVQFSSAITAKAVVAIQLSGANGVLTSGTSATGTGTGTAGSTSASITCTPNSGADCAWIGGIGLEGPSTDNGPDTDAEWNNPENHNWLDGTSGGGAVSNITTYSGYEIVSTTVTQAGDATWTTSRDWAMTLINFLEPAAAGAARRRVTISGAGGD